MNKKNIILISYDAFSQDNWDYGKNLPNLKKLIENGGYTNKLKSVYPTLTYVVHSTISTGCYPNKHGIYHNTPLQPFVSEENQQWFWNNSNTKVNTVYEEASKHKLKVASLLWPVTAKAKIKYNIPEIKALNKENQAIKVLKNGSILYTLEMELKNGHIRKGIQQPYLDDYTTKCAVNTIKTKNIDLLMVHFIDLDDQKHNYGTNSEEVKKAMERMDKRIGHIIKAVNKSKKDDTIFIIVGDHGQIDVKHKIKLNKILVDIGLIFEKDGKLEYKAYFQSAGGSAYLHIKNNDPKVEKKVIEAITKIMEDDKWGIDQIIDKTALTNLKASSITNYMIEAKEGYTFIDDIDGNNIDVNGTYATHGYLPCKDNYLCNLVISGKDIKNNYFIDNVEMVDIAPTISKLLGFDFKCDGRVLDEIFLH